MKYRHLLPDGSHVDFDNAEDYNAYMAANHPEDPEIIAKAVAKEGKAKRISFGLKLVEEYQAKNDTLGFDSLTRAQRKPINAILRRVYRELQEGYLKDAIEEIRETVNAEFDGTYVRKSRYLKLRNDIHDYLGMPKVANYND